MGYVDQHDRDYFMHFTNIYVKGVKERLLPIFNDLEAQAEEAQQQYYEHQISQPGTGDEDPSEIALFAQLHGMGHYQDMDYLMRQVTNTLIANLYHFWERELKSYLQRTVVRYAGANEQKIISADFMELVKILDRYGFDFQHMSYYEQFDDLRLVANAIKHGAGRSLADLIAKRPDLFRKNSISGDIDPDIDNLELAEDHFDQFADALKQFWETFDISDTG